MKIEKITENKIRIILKKEDFKDKSINLQKFLNTPESQSLFLEILNRAEREVDFDTNGHKLLIETYFQGNDICIFTITKYIESKLNVKNKPKKYLIPVFIALFLIRIFPCSFNLNLKFLLYFNKLENSNKEE